jgi:hypothetical protein
MRLRWLLYPIAPFCLRTVMRLVYATLHLEVLNPEVYDSLRDSPRPIIGAFLHGRQFTLPIYFRWRRRRPIVLLTSVSPDGGIQARLLGGLGYEIIRGSTSRRGAEAFLGLLRALEAGRDTALAVDGPRGPYGKVHDGVLELARRTGGTIVPVTFSAARARVFDRAWDLFLLPRCFSRTVILYGRTFQVPPSADAAELARLRLELETELARITREADHRVGRPTPMPAPNAAPPPEPTPTPGPIPLPTLKPSSPAAPAPPAGATPALTPTGDATGS